MDKDTLIRKYKLREILTNNDYINTFIYFLYKYFADDILKVKIGFLKDSVKIFCKNDITINVKPYLFLSFFDVKIKIKKGKHKEVIDFYMDDYFDRREFINIYKAFKEL